MVKANIQTIALDNSARAIDPNVLQRKASVPDSSVWVGASAGSGKTKVLTDRILRLMLPQENMIATPPHKILALTFTKAAASEMALRINDALSKWATMPLMPEGGNSGLIENLKSLLGAAPTQEQIDAARKLFARVIDVPGGLKIMTIHSFCQSILSRFPLEADLPPNFRALEENQAQILLRQSTQAAFKKADLEKGSPLAGAVNNIAFAQNEEQFTSLLQGLLSERKQMTDILGQYFNDPQSLYTALCQDFDIIAGQSADKILYEFCNDKNKDEDGLRKACAALAKGTEKSDQPKSDKIQDFLDADNKGRVELYDVYKFSFLTQEGGILKSLATKKVQGLMPNILEIMSAEASAIIETENKTNCAKIAELTRDLFLIGQEIINEYAALKAKTNLLDFDDLILKTLDLLEGNTQSLSGLKVSPWVRYKLDQGIDHVLVDEAQDTNPEQWGIIQALCDDFFDGSAKEDVERTLFVVGDEKQSIFSFQRASPEKFQDMRAWFSEKIMAANKKFSNVDFNISFRSVPAILDVVDKVFADPNVQKGLSKDIINHQSFRHTQGGLVELWPLFETPEKQEFDPWAPPIEIIDSTTGASQMAEHIGNTIQKWIGTKDQAGEVLESHGRTIMAGDIMILVRSRTAFIDQLVRSLKTRNIPVSGVDRMVLNDQLVVQDLTAAAQFGLLPEDDLTLAGLLKSPFIGWGEDQLFAVAHGREREKTLWQAAQDNGDKATINWLERLIKKVSREKPYDFFATILQSACPAHEISGLQAIKARLGEECLDPLDEFLNMALHFERENIPSLQNFVQTQLQDNTQIKRQMEEGINAVRIMTVHGAKGLQAPIVILPDTVRSSGSAKPERILWPDRSGAALPYFCPQSKDVPTQCRMALDTLKERQDEEYRRLLYVALTRAENRLYVGGYKAARDPAPESWYRYVENAFKTLDNLEEEALGEKTILRFRNAATDDKPDRTHKNVQEPSTSAVSSPEWLFQPMPEEQFPPRPLRPSRPSEEDAPALSPLKSGDNQRFLRGNITHKLLQILPDLPNTQRRTAAEKFVRQPAHGLDVAKQQSIVLETMAILENPKFAPIFGEGSLSEVPISGVLDDGTLISGQIDRLLVTPDKILIIDYKTNRPPPRHAKDVPTIYIKQMKAYADIMTKIYPEQEIVCALIWTDGAQMMEISF